MMNWILLVFAYVGLSGGIATHTEHFSVKSQCELAAAWFERRSEYVTAECLPVSTAPEAE